MYSIVYQMVKYPQHLETGGRFRKSPICRMMAACHVAGLTDIFDNLNHPSYAATIEDLSMTRRLPFPRGPLCFSTLLPNC